MTRILSRQGFMPTQNSALRFTHCLHQASNQNCRSILRAEWGRRCSRGTSQTGLATTAPTWTISPGSRSGKSLTSFARKNNFVAQIISVRARTVGDLLGWGLVRVQTVCVGRSQPGGILLALLNWICFCIWTIVTSQGLDQPGGIVSTLFNCICICIWSWSW